MILLTIQFRWMSTHVKNLYGLRVWLNGSWLYFIGDKELSPQYREAILEK